MKFPKTLCVLALALLLAGACESNDGGDVGTGATDAGVTSGGGDAAVPVGGDAVVPPGGDVVLTPGVDVLIPAGVDVPGAVDTGGCLPSCGTRACGSNGCGGTCGSCSAGESCQNGACAVSPPACDRRTFSKLVSETVVTAEGALRHEALDRLGSGGRGIEVRIQPGAATAPGVFQLAGPNAADCELCVFGRAGCNADFDCERAFVAHSGTVTITATGAVGDQFTATVSAVLQEATIDPATGASTLLADGEVWCLTDYTIDDPIISDPDDNGCVPGGTGTRIDDLVGDFTVQMCDGSEFSLHDLCGRVKAIWVVGTTGWCPACKELMPVALEWEDCWQEQGDSMKLLVVLGEDWRGEEPDLAYCEQYARNEKIDLSQIVIDPFFQKLFSRMDPYGSGGSIAVPWQALLDGDDMRYAWTSGPAGMSLSMSVINDLLTD